MKTYRIPIRWESFERFEVEAENLEEAVTKALKEFLAIPDDKYIEDSFEIDSGIEEDYSDEDFDLDKVFFNL